MEARNETPFPPDRAPVRQRLRSTTHRTHPLRRGRRKAGVSFTHSFGAAKLGSLLESTGAGAVWFDYDNDGLLDLYAVSGKPLGPGMHPYPLRKRRRLAAHNHLFRNDGNGKFTDVTDAAGVARRSVQHGRHRRRLR